MKTPTPSANTTLATESNPLNFPANHVSISAIVTGNERIVCFLSRDYMFFLPH